MMRFSPLLKTQFSYRKFNFFRFQCIIRFCPPNKNLHFLAGKSMFFVSRALFVFVHKPTHFGPLRKTFIFLQENQYFAFSCFQQTIFCFQNVHFPAGKTNILRFKCIIRFCPSIFFVSSALFVFAVGIWCRSLAG